MDVLIADFDLFQTVGGGQTFYRSIIARHPHIEFYYLTRHEPPQACRPANAHPIPYREQYGHARWADFQDALPPHWCLNSFVQANNIACSVSGRRFDVVDLPDYERFGAFLRPALRRHQVRADRVALSLHGCISTSLRLNWRTEGRTWHHLVQEEDLQFQTVDLRYGLSRTYLDEWHGKFDLAAHYLSPLRFLDLPTPVRAARAPSPPDIYFVGRTEKRKGPDLFVELAWWLPLASYGRAAVIGPECFDPQGVGSNQHLYRMAAARLGERRLALLPTAGTAELQRLFASRAVTILPSRYDTFLLTAMESLFSGCPTAIGSGAGVCRFLKETFPEVPFIEIDVDAPHASVPPLAELLTHYDDYRDRLVEAILASRPEVEGPSLTEIYSSAPAFHRGVRAELDEWYERLWRHEPLELDRGRLEIAARWTARRLTTPNMRRNIRAMHPRKVAGEVKQMLRRRLETTWLWDRLRTARLMAAADPLVAQYQQVHRAPESSDRDIDAKLELCARLVSQIRVDRVRLWREMARLESLRGRDLVAATYRLRAMRLAGSDRYGDLPLVRHTLLERGFEREASVAEAMFGANGDDRCGDMLQAAFDSHRRLGETPFEFIDDRRAANRYKASVIVSLYNAADKLPMFLRALGVQTLLRAGRAEVVLVDSGSPGEEYAVFKQLAGELPGSFVYVRTAARETIQGAWNRGIGVARGEHLSFLGVDEGLLPPALEILADELDADPSLDWVQANSLVTNVNERGHWTGDIMTYDRADYRQSLVYLETCYLSWVGAMYRREMHDRVGYYDASFGAAGDTEFKNRVLPFIKTKAIGRTLGVFWNYPSGQTTCGPRAELEDLRAWYLHRTPSGVRRALAPRGPLEAEELLAAATRYRKSYCRHWSTDIELAHNVSLFLREMVPDSPITNCHAGLWRLLEVYRGLDCLPRITGRRLRASVRQATVLAERLAADHQRHSGMTIQPAFHVFNDNRYEQHTQIWRPAA